MQKNDPLNNYYSSSIAVFEILQRSTYAMMPKMLDEQKEHLINMKEGFEDLVNLTDPDIESVSGIAAILNIKFNQNLFLHYIQHNSENKFQELLSEDNVNIDLLGLVSGIQASVISVSNTLSKLDKGIKLDEFYTDFKPGSSFVFGNINDLNYSVVTIYNDLVESHKETLSNIEDIKFYEDVEYKEFNRLFIPGQKSSGWEYLADRLGFKEVEIETIYLNRMPVINGTYVFTFFDTERDRRLDYATLIAVRKYLEFLTDTEGSGKINIVDDRDRNYPNFALRPEYHKNIESAYALLENEFIISDLDTFKGVFVPGAYKGKVRISSHATVAEIKLLLTYIEDYINGYSNRWIRSSLLFEKGDGTSFTKNSFNTAKHKQVPSNRQKQIENIAKTFKML